MTDNFVNGRGLLRSLTPKHGEESDRITDVPQSDTAADQQSVNRADDNDSADSEGELPARSMSDVADDVADDVRDDAAIRRIHQLAKRLSFKVTD